MSDLTILFHSERWLERAARARGIAMLLSMADAEVVETYAAECEATAQRLIDEQKLPIAA